MNTEKDGLSLESYVAIIKLVRGPNEGNEECVDHGIRS